MPMPSPNAHPRPEWLRVKFFGGERYQDLKRIMRTLDLHTVCESARCPNMGECWEHRTATFMILGNICTRACGFCAVPSGKPLGPPEEDEPDQTPNLFKDIHRPFRTRQERQCRDRIETFAGRCPRPDAVRRVRIANIGMTRDDQMVGDTNDRIALRLRRGGHGHNILTRGQAAARADVDAEIHRKDAPVAGCPSIVCYRVR